MSAVMNAAPVALRDDFAVQWESKKQLIRDTYARNLTDEEFALFGAVCARRRLDPLSGQITAFKFAGRVSFSPTIQGARVIAMRTREYAGCDEVVFRGSKTEYGCTHPTSASVTVYRLVGGVRCAFTATLDWNERAPRDPDVLIKTNWFSMPKTMLAGKVEKLALSMAFPEDFADLAMDVEYDEGIDGEQQVAAATSVARVDRMIATVRDRLTTDQQETMHAEALARGVRGIHPVDPEQTPSTQRWSEIVNAINGAYRLRKMTPPYMGITGDGRLNPGEIFNAMIGLPDDMGISQEPNARTLAESESDTEGDAS